jgi:hypothetical protein
MLPQLRCIDSTTSTASIGTMCLDVSRCVIAVITTCNVLFDDDVQVDDVCDEMTVHTITTIIVLQHTKDF